MTINIQMKIDQMRLPQGYFKFLSWLETTTGLLPLSV